VIGDIPARQRPETVLLAAMQRVLNKTTIDGLPLSELSSIDAALLCRFYGYLHKDMDINNDERDPFAPSANRPPSCEQS
jgi:hypothetical protein